MPICIPPHTYHIIYAPRVSICSSNAEIDTGGGGIDSSTPNSSEIWQLPEYIEEELAQMGTERHAERLVIKNLIGSKEIMSSSKAENDISDTSTPLWHTKVRLF